MVPIILLETVIDTIKELFQNELGNFLLEDLSRHTALKGLELRKIKFSEHVSHHHLFIPHYLHLAGIGKREVMAISQDQVKAKIVYHKNYASLVGNIEDIQT